MCCCFALYIIAQNRRKIETVFDEINYYIIEKKLISRIKHNVCICIRLAVIFLNATCRYNNANREIEILSISNLFFYW